MTYAVVYSSQTGNTKTLAIRIRDILGKENCIYFGNIPDKGGNKLTGADVVFAGFWTDKGTCSDEMRIFLGSLENQSLFLFGTAGFGGAKTYFDQILDRVSSIVSRSCNITGTFMCQGRMPESVKKRYEAMQAENQEDDKARGKLDNYEKALSHPNAEDLTKLEEDVKRIWKD